MMRLKLRKIGHSVGVIFPRKVLAAMNIDAGDAYKGAGGLLALSMIPNSSGK